MVQSIVMEYIETVFTVSPFSEDIADWITAEVSSIGYDSFVTEEPYLKAYIRKEEFSEENLEAAMAVFSGLPGTEVTYVSSLMPQKNWNEIWESSFEPIVLGTRFSVRAPFHRNVPHTDYEIVIEPKMAFGTGHHQTTLLMVGNLLSAGSLEGKKVLDMGCGTGILAILAAMLGAEKPVKAIDIDDVAAESARENAAVNSVSLDVSCGDASAIEEASCDLLLANINRNILISDMPVYEKALLPGGKLFVSGFYEKDIEALRERAESLGLSFVSSSVSPSASGDWASVIFEKGR